MDGTSLTPEQEKINALRQVLPEAFSEGKIDWEKLKATLGENINFSNERYVLNWAGKSDAFKILQTPTTKTLIPDKSESVNFETTQNIFIEGENLEVLKVLQKSYFGKVKMIYIDPPYNTGNDSFIYPDKFSETKVEYEKRVGDKDEDGYMTKDGLFRKNSKENGQYHSNWLNMMMPRLYLAKNLLRQDGLIFISIDFNELHNLKLLCNEIFGEENFRNQAIIKRGAKSVQAQFDTWDKLGVGFEYVLVYSKNSDYRFPKIMRKLEESRIGVWNNHWRGTDRPTMRYELFNIKPEEGQWRWGKERSIEAINNYKKMLTDLGESENSITQKKIDNWYIEQNDEDIDLLRLSSNGKPEHYIPPTDSMLLNDVWFDIPPHSSRILKSLFGKKLFDNPKPLELIYRVMDFGNSNDIILDFFAGSGTTAHAVMDLNKQDGGNRKYICVQLPELCDEKSEAYKAGYKTIADISKERIRRAGKKIGEEVLKEIKKIESEIKKLQGELPTEETKIEIENLKDKIEQLKNQDLGFKVLKSVDSNFKQWQQIEGKDAKATRTELAETLQEQMKLFVDPVSENATIENLVYELLLKSGKDLNSTIEKKESFYKINGNELVLLLEKATQEVIDAVMAEKPIKVIALDKLFKGNDQLKTNTVLQMRDAEIEFKTI